MDRPDRFQGKVNKQQYLEHDECMCVDRNIQNSRIDRPELSDAFTARQLDVLHTVCATYKQCRYKLRYEVPKLNKKQGPLSHCRKATTQYCHSPRLPSFHSQTTSGAAPIHLLSGEELGHGRCYFRAPPTESDGLNGDSAKSIPTPFSHC